MKIRVEHYGDKIAVDGNLVDLIQKKEVQLLLTIKEDDDKSRTQFILNKVQAEELIQKLRDRLEDPVLKENGFKVV